MEFKVFGKSDGKVFVVEVPERLEANISDKFRVDMNELVDGGNFQIVIDLKKTEFMDSSGLGALVSRIAVMRSNGGDVRLASVSPFVMNLLQVTHLDQVFKCFDDMESAVSSFTP